jgi:hypothetical protein
MFHGKSVFICPALRHPRLTFSDENPFIHQALVFMVPQGDALAG